MAIGSFWKTDEKYVIQFDKVKPREKTIIFNTLKEWSESGSGYHKDGTEIFIFSNKTLDEENVYGLVKSMPFPFTEEKRNGTIKKIRTNHTTKKLDLTSQKNDVKIGGRTCSKCGVKGHNSRTCKA